MVPEVTIPPEVTPENVTTSIVDTSCELTWSDVVNQGGRPLTFRSKSPV